MAFADLLDPNTYARRDTRNYSDLVAAALKNQQAGANVQATGLENQYNQATMDPRVAEQQSKALEMDQANQESGMKLEANQAIHPEIMRQLQAAGQAQAAPQVTPALSQSSAPQSAQAPAQQAQGIAPQALPAQQAQGPKDRYAPVEQGISRDQALLDQKKQHLTVASYDPTNPTGFVAEKDRNAQALEKEQEGIDSRKFSLGVNRAWDAAAPGLNSAVQDEMKANGSIDQAAYNRILGKVNQTISENPTLTKADGYKEFVALLEKNKPNPTALVLNQPPDPSVVNHAIARIAEGKSTLSQEMKKSGRGGPAAQMFHDQLAEGVPAYVRPGETAPLKPDFSEAADEGGNTFAQSPKVKAALTQMENAYSTVGRLRDVFGALKNGQFPSLNAAINAGAVQLGDVESARANIAAILGNDELTKAFAGGGVPTDKLREMAGALVNKNLAPEQMNAQFDELLQGTERQYNAYQAQSAGHIKPLDTKKYGGEPKAPSAAASHPQASQAEQWAKANPNDPRAKTILQRLGK
jgi:hypothetical protein